MLHAPQGLHAFFRAYYHYKSADWKGNKPHPLKARTAEEMAKIPTYYVMEKDKGMAETVAAVMPSAAEIAACKWLTEAEVDVYATEYAPDRLHRRAARLSRAARHRSRRPSPRCAHSPAARSTCRPASSPARATGGRIRLPASFEEMQTPRACTQMARLPSRRRRRALGAAGAAGRREQAARAIRQRMTTVIVLSRPPALSPHISSAADTGTPRTRRSAAPRRTA